MENSTPVLSVAEAVAAATNAQNQQISHPSPPAQTQGNSGIDNLTCQWQGCGERCDTAESLYDHVCERHVGRKSTNNLNLTCQWGACRTTTVKRDHITSHIRVHVPLKPHKCDFCGKAFKRPQDLKKHVKTHADDSVLMNSPSQGNSRSMGGSGGMGQNGKPYGYSPAQHDGGMGNPYPGYQPSMSNGSNGYAQTAGNGQYAGYGSVSYPASNMQDVQSMDTRRRAIEALNDFLGDIKRRAIDPNSYYDVGHRLQSNALPLPVGNGYNTGYSQPVAGGYTNYNTTASILESFNQGGHMGGSGGSGGVSLASGYSLPLPNARTKNDLQDIDRFLEQLQATVYETSNHVAAAGFQQPGVHSIHTGDFGYNNHQSQYRSSHSPTSYSSNSSVGALGAMSSGTGLPNVTSTALETPALTPAASVTSYASSGQSPMSSHGRASLGSLGGYPNLPAVTGMSDLGAGYPSTTSAPASSLASGFEGLDGRRYSGGHLRRQAPAKTEDTEMADYEDGARTPKASEAQAKGKGASSIDPALRGEDEKSPSESASTPAASASEGAEDKRQEEWVENIRVIEALRKWVADRIKHGEFESEAAAAAAAASTEDAKEGADSKSVEIAKMVEEKMADADDDSQRVDYPTLPSSS